MTILIGDFNAKVGREDIFKPMIGNESIHEANNDNRVCRVRRPKHKWEDNITLDHREIWLKEVDCMHLA
jgi:hypothetical protein